MEHSPNQTNQDMCFVLINFLYYRMLMLFVSQIINHIVFAQDSQLIGGVLA